VALLVKCEESKGNNTAASQKFVLMSYGVFVKATENVPTNAKKVRFTRKTYYFPLR